MKNFYNNGSKSGFSLIEMMVATAVFLVMVTMIGGIFRQTSSSWEAGYARAEGGMIVRGVIGTIQRELATAVDGRQFKGVWDLGDNAPPVEVTKHKLSFICLKESGKRSENKREPYLISYTWGSSTMRREATPLHYDVQRDEWRTESSPPPTTVYSEDSDSLFSANFEFQEIKPPNYPKKSNRDFESDEKFWTIPCVAIKLELTRTGSFSGLEVRSLGRNGVRDGTDAKSKDDDIISN
jgi:prepilin-type N-terminal cleavage/methylation domain-containing protein